MVLVLSGLVACQATGTPASSVAPPTGTSSSALPGPVEPKVPFRNPGGLWLPEQISRHAEQLRSLGLTLDPDELSDPLSGPLRAIVRLNGCSASFVSPDGLIATNHHCALGALQYNSTPSANLLRNGFLAKERKEELWAGPTGRMQLTRAFRDVTQEAHAALAAATDDLSRQRALERFQKQTEAACEKERPAARCELKSFYLGLRYFLVEQLELRDVRLVYAPPSGIGNFGGEVDNWRWPRHTGDFAFFRAYLSPHGKPSDHHTANVPYRPAQHLALATQPLAEGDLVIVAGYPGRTSTFAWAKQIEETVTWLYPRRIAMFDEFIRTVDAVRAENADAHIKGTGLIRRFSNFRTKHQGELEGLARGKLLEQKRAEQAELSRFIAASPARVARFGGAIEAIEAAYAVLEPTREPDTALQAELLQARLLWAACVIVRMAEERQKPDAERAPEYQDRKVSELRDQLAALDKQYHPLLDRALLELALKRQLAMPLAQRSAALALLAGPEPSEASIERAVTQLYPPSGTPERRSSSGTARGDSRTRLDDVEVRLALFEKATPDALARSGDPLIRAAVALRPVLRAAEERRDRFSGVLLREGPRYAAALLEKKGGDVAPDANGTLRVSYGLVQGPPGGGSAFTRVSEIVAKNQGKEPFDAPSALLEAVREQRFGSYARPGSGQVPVDFLSDAPITNGNSGSATLDREGKLTGLAFDGTFDSVVSDFGYQPITRSIHVDLRYLLWVLDAVEKADSLLAELGVRPQSPR